MGVPEQAVILLIDDSENDVLLAKRALAKAGIFNPLYVVHNGEETIAYLEGAGPFSSRDEYPLPELVLLDLKMPGLNGFEVLQWIREQPNLKGLRVIVLTTSEDIHDVNRAYQMGANSFLMKPFDFDHYTDMARTLGSFWLDHSQAPKLARKAPKNENHL